MALAVVLAASAAAAFDAVAQEARRPKTVAFLSLGFNKPPLVCIDGLRQGLEQAGWPEGKSYRLEARFAESKEDRLPALAQELVALRPDVLVTVGLPTAVALRDATREVPIVTLGAGSLLKVGLIASLDRPGGNVTGQSLGDLEHWIKPFDILAQSFPKAGTIGAVLNKRNPAHGDVAVLEEAARPAQRRLAVAWFDGDVGLDAAWQSLAAQGAAAVLIVPDMINYTPAHSREATKLKLPAISHHRKFAEDGGLLSYGLPTWDVICRRGARYVSEILKGRRPQDLPVEELRDADLIVNLKTARALGIALPPDVVARAARLIE